MLRHSLLLLCSFVLAACATAPEMEHVAVPEPATEVRSVTEARAIAERAELHFQTGRFDQAIPLFRRAIELRPDSSRLYHRVAESYIGLGLFDEAERWGRRARANTPEVPFPGFWHCISGLGATLEGDREALVVHTDSLLDAASPEGPSAWACAANAEVYLGEYEEAKRHIERFRAEAPERPAPLAHYGFVLLQMGEEERATEVLRDYEAQRRKEIAEDPGKWNAHFALAEIAAVRGDADAAVRHLREAIRGGAADRFRFYYTVSGETWGDPIWAGVRGHLDFERLMAERKAEIERMRERVIGQNGRAELVERLDSLARVALAKESVAGFSVAVLRGSDTLLLKGYGHADVGLGVPATEETKYRLTDPSNAILAALLMQLVEQGRITLDDDITPHLPDFPWQGRSVSLRQLMDATSGLPDFHYLGDPYLAEVAVPKSQDEVTALFAGHPFTHEPGERYQWTISGFHLAGILLERLTGRSFEDLVEEEIARPLGLEQTSYCGGREVVADLATGYQTAGDSLLLARPESPSMYPFTATVCASAGDVATFYQALREGRLIGSEAYADMTTLSEASEEFFERTGRARAVGVGLGGLEGHPMTDVLGALEIGYASAASDFAEEDLTAVVLSNTHGAPIRPLALDLSRAALGLPLSTPAAADASQALQDLPIPATDMERYAGTYRTQKVDPPPPYHAYERTYRIYPESGRLMIQPIGEVPERLLRQGEHTFVRASHPEQRITFIIEDGRSMAIEIEAGRMSEAGERIQGGGEALPRRSH